MSHYCEFNLNEIATLKQKVEQTELSIVKIGKILEEIAGLNEDRQKTYNVMLEVMEKMSLRVKNLEDNNRIGRGVYK